MQHPQSRNTPHSYHTTQWQEASHPATDQPAILTVDPNYVRQGVKRSTYCATITMALFPFLAAIALMSNDPRTAAARKSFGDVGLMIFTSCTALVFIAGFWTFGRRKIGKLIMQSRYVIVTNETLVIALGPTYYTTRHLVLRSLRDRLPIEDVKAVEFLFLNQSPWNGHHRITLRQDDRHGNWHVSQAAPKSRRVKLPIRAFPTLDLFLRANVPGLIEQ